ncbi:hypothetical protein ACOYX4_13525 [Enterococcus entomosocium]|uniref:hypothetical protein n=1 Tax=Enterococcus entomosocium TaxID=3034352 RepID=UPI003BE0F745
MKIRVRNTIKLDIEGAVKTYAPSWTVYKIDDEIAKEKNYSQRFRKYPEHIEIVEDVAEDIKLAGEKVNDIPEGTEEKNKEEAKKDQEEESQITEEKDLSPKDQKNLKDSEKELAAESRKTNKKATPKKNKKKNEE